MGELSFFPCKDLLCAVSATTPPTRMGQAELPDYIEKIIHGKSKKQATADDFEKHKSKWPTGVWSALEWNLSATLAFLKRIGEILKTPWEIQKFKLSAARKIFDAIGRRGGRRVTRGH